MLLLDGPGEPLYNCLLDQLLCLVLCVSTIVCATGCNVTARHNQTGTHQAMNKPLRTPTALCMEPRTGQASRERSLR